MTSPARHGPFFSALTGLIDFYAGLKEIDESKIWGRTLETVCSALGAKAATYYEFNPEVRHLVARNAIGVSPDDLPSMPLAGGRGLCVWSATHCEAAIANDPYHDPRFEKDIDHVTGFETQTLLAVPIMEDKSLVGVVEFLNKEAGRFESEDLEFASAAFRMALMVSRMLRFERIRDKVASYNASILENLSGGFVAVDVHGQIILCNPAARRILSLRPDLTLPVAADELLAAAPRMAEILLDALEKKATVKRAEFSWKAGGRERVIGYSTILIQDTHGTMTGAGISFQDITAAKGAA